VFSSLPPHSGNVGMPLTIVCCGTHPPALWIYPEETDVSRLGDFHVASVRNHWPVLLSFLPSTALIGTFREPLPSSPKIRNFLVFLEPKVRPSPIWRRDPDFRPFDPRPEKTQVFRLSASLLAQRRTFFPCAHQVPVGSWFPTGLFPTGRDSFSPPNSSFDPDSVRDFLYSRMGGFRGSNSIPIFSSNTKGFPL